MGRLARRRADGHNKRGHRPVATATAGARSSFRARVRYAIDTKVDLLIGVSTSAIPLGCVAALSLGQLSPESTERFEIG